MEQDWWSYSQERDPSQSTTTNTANAHPPLPVPVPPLFNGAFIQQQQQHIEVDLTEGRFNRQYPSQSAFNVDEKSLPHNSVQSGAGPSSNPVPTKHSSSKGTGAPPGAIVTDKSCVRCRVRKVRCNRVWPRCQHCIQRDEDCDLKDWRPKPKKVTTDPARVAYLEKRLAELEATLADSSKLSAASGQTGATARPAGQIQPSTTYDPAQQVFASLEAADAAPSFFDLSEFSDSSNSPAQDAIAIGTGSIDWRLATSQMAPALSRSLCEAFFESCCFMLPTYTYYWPRIAQLKADDANLSKASKVAIASFRAVGARTSNHSALLGITMDTDTPNAALLSAGTRRQSACRTFYNQAHTAAFESGLAEEVAEENLAVLLTLLQMSIFVELQPKRSRTLLRNCLDIYKELNDAATAQNKRELRRTFGFAIYVADSVISASAGRNCAISDHDLREYFGQMGLVIPRLPDDRLWSVIEKTLDAGRAAKDLRVLVFARHLIQCWVCAAQRMFAKLASPPTSGIPALIEGIRSLWIAIDQIRLTIQQTLNYITVYLDPNAFNHTHDPDGHHHHDTDWVPQLIRLDRDLLDLIFLIHGTLSTAGETDELSQMRRESLSRARKGLRALALYAKMYVDGSDRHVIFHLIFQLDLLPNWTELALQRVGDPHGPQNPDEELTETERQWFLEGLRLACFYFPDAEKRLEELSPRITPVEQNVAPALDSIPSVTTPDLTSFLSLDPSFEDLLTGFNGGNSSIDGIDGSMTTDSNGLNPGIAGVSTVPFSVDAFFDDSLMQ